MKKVLFVAFLVAAAATPALAQGGYPAPGYYPTLEAWRLAGWRAGLDYGGYGYSGRTYLGGLVRVGGGYPGYYGYSGGWYGRADLTGLKFHLELIPLGERELVKRGIVLVDGAEVGVVNRHDGWWNSPMPVAPGEHEIGVTLEDGRVFQTRVFVQHGQLLHIYPRFAPVGFQPAAMPQSPPAAAAPASAAAPQAPTFQAAPPEKPDARCAHLAKYPTLQAWCLAGPPQ